MAPTRQLDMVRKPRDIVRPAPVVESTPSPRLSRKRSKRRKQMLIALAVVIIILGGVALWGIWQPALRVERITVAGSSASDLEPLVQQALMGTYLHILPRNSIFLVPTSRIRANILAAHPELGAVSISRPAFDLLSVTVLPRTNAYWWCGTDGVTATSTVSDAPDGSASCYDTDPEGFIFETASLPSASSTMPTTDVPLQTVRVYAPTDSPSPIGSHVLFPNRIPVALELARTLAGMKASPVSLVVRGDEGDFFLASGTRLTFVLGDETNAAQRAAAVLPTVNVSDGSIEYVDLRFDGKVYVKKNPDSTGNE